MFKNIKAAIFDLDGTLIDSMGIWSKIDIDFLKKRNIEFPSDLKDDIESLGFEETSKYFKKRFNLPETIEEIQNEWFDMAYKEYSNNVPLKPYAKEFLEFLKKLGLKIALTTSNCNLLVQATFKKNNIAHLFDVITTTDEVSRGKSFPDVYLLTAKKLNIAPSECIVFEDILPAIKGAKAAGMKVIGVHDTFSEYQKDMIISHADKYINSFNELTEKAV
ncbi:2-deoxyglucose-6-phosphate phosphatase [Clostridium tepidiprofundi DSM 19306]|uniref:2-deoxyglucose-6-phosphate phosphatase n=1 Tax=Clostridium tepidiprofundi DSM 19306 TaxID=1121338 RepID=A0A151B355_9CLOT|nr:HAD family phosphatase [Clostridium tepidiprofundi]KYH34348.1 2-deoxyglucose-6-phosphate phosphatase [Clostridium tepidiprofundi DSM 19306]